MAPSLLLLLTLISLAAADEKSLLLQLKAAFNNPPRLSSWNPSTDHCTWPEVKCDNHSSVTSLLLSNYNISTQVPASICDLQGLSHLDLSYNDIPGPFPQSLYNCTGLLYLDLSQNYLSGAIPSSINRLPNNLQVLNLSANNLYGDIPSQIGQLAGLHYLQLDNNWFNGTFPVEIGNLYRLERLCLGYNNFSASPIPEEFGNLRNLTYLWMSKTNLVGGIPGSFGRLEKLEWLDLAMNSLSGEIPQGIWMLERLEFLYLYHNRLTGGIDKKIGGRSFVEIDLSMNQLTGPIPAGFGDLSNLTKLFLYWNQLSGEIPAGIGLLPSLYDVRLFDNNLTGGLPSELGKHSKLWNLEVDDNSLTGELPQFLCSGKNLISLVVFNNKFSGSIPDSLGSCPTLNTVMVQNNSFSGGVPAGIWTAVNLTTVKMQGNSLSGTLPERLPWNLTRLEIQSNRFSGSIPLSAQRLAVFKGSNNLFSGNIPVNLSQLASLQVLSLGGNQISGEIPGSISSLKWLNDLDLSDNQLTGEIPESIGSLQVLTTVDLSSNKLTGPIPASMGDMKLNFLNLSSNDLSGEIPVPLQNPVYSFLANPNLCSSNSANKIQTCNQRSTSSSSLSTKLLVLFIVLGVVFFFAAAAMGLFTVREYRRRKLVNKLPAWKMTSFHRGEFNESRIVKGLTEENLIGSGGAGLVYKIGESLAVKKIWNCRKLDSKLEQEFEAEVQILGSIRHANIVKLLCCISNSDSKLLVYEYVEKGSLDRWLHSKHRVASGGSGRSEALDWPARLKIAVGAAKGLCYMHHDLTPPIVHRDVKSSNILLDSDLNAKIADFGLARMLVKAGEPESVSALAGSFGYMAPECGWLMMNEKVDVYSFGVVLLELTTGKEALYGDEHRSLSEWAWRCFQEGGSLIDAIDEEIRELAYLDDILAVLRLGIICTGALPEYRPTMKEVLQVLQQCNEITGNGLNKMSEVGEYDVAPLIATKRGSRRKRTSDSEKDGDDQSEDSFV